MILCSWINQQFFGNDGKPAVSYKLFVYLATTTTKTPTYKDVNGSATNTNPIVLDYRGECALWLDPTLAYKFVLALPNDTDPPTNPVKAVDNVPGVMAQSIFNSLYGMTPDHQTTAAEIAASVVPVNKGFVPGNPRRYGAVGNGVADDTAALTACIASNASVIFQNGDIYGVTTVTFPFGGPRYIDFNGATIRGIATVATNCIVKLEMEGTTFIDYRVDGNFSQKYLCGTWWYNAVSSAQYNRVFGMRHTYLGGIQTASGTTVRSMIYGALVGAGSTGFAQSENVISGWNTRGCQNPFYSNHVNGVIFFSNPIFVCVNEEWVGVYDFNKARCFECVNGSLIVQGGEIQFASAGGLYAAEAKNCFFDGAFIETAYPILITGDKARFTSGRFLQDQLVPCFTVSAAVTGMLICQDMYFNRPAGVGAFDNNPIVDATAANAAFETRFANTQSFEYRWTCVGADVRLIKGGIARYTNHRMSMTAADANIYMIDNSPRRSLLEALSFDRLGYTVNGWALTIDFGGGTTMVVTTVAGPTNYLASQITLHATGQAIAGVGDGSSLAQLKATATRVRPGECYWISANCNISAGAAGQLQARFYDLTGALISDVAVADATFLGTGAWKYAEGPVAVPATAAYMIPSVRGNVSDIRVTDLMADRADR